VNGTSDFSTAGILLPLPFDPEGSPSYTEVFAGAKGWALMPKDKDESPLTKKTPFEEILKVPSDQIKEKVRKKGPKAEEGLMTSKDLFGDIIDDFDEDHPGPPASSSGKITAKVPEPTTQADLPLDHVRADEKKPPDEKPTRGKIRSDTVPGEYLPSEGQHRPDEDSLVDLAYSTLLQDDRLNRALHGMETTEAQELSDGAVDYGQYLLVDLVAVGGMAEVFRAKRKGIKAERGRGFRKDRGRKADPASSIAQQGIRRYVHRRGQDGGRAFPSEYRSNIRPGEDRG
jgi:hypothetical protein